jgi:multimeric flavodoxin WrbA
MNGADRGCRSRAEKILAADAVILQFPLWWFGMPAILKGWIDRVYAYGFAYGYKGVGNRFRYGDGALKGKRAMLSVMCGGPEQDYSPRGINAPLEHCSSPSPTACSFTRAWTFFRRLRSMGPGASARKAWRRRKQHGACVSKASLRTRPFPSAGRMAQTSRTATSWRAMSPSAKRDCWPTSPTSRRPNIHTRPPPQPAEMSA